MLVYFLLLILTIISLLLYKSKKNQIFAVLPFVFMAFVGGFRENVGADYKQYVFIFDRYLENLSITSYVEVGFRNLIRLIILIGGSHQMMFFVTSVVTCMCYYIFIRDNSDDFCMSTILFMCLGPFYLSTFNIMRQTLAVAIVLCGLKYCYIDRKKYWFYVIIATTFHITAVFYFLLPFTKKFKKEYLFFFVGLSIIGCLFVRFGIIDLFLALSSNYDKFIGLGGRSWNLSYLVFLLISLFVIIWKPLYKAIDQKAVLMVIVAAVMIVSAYGEEKYGIFVTRLISLCSPIFIIVIPEITKKIRPYYVMKLGVYSFCMAYFYKIIKTGASILPYTFNFNLLR